MAEGKHENLAFAGFAFVAKYRGGKNRKKKKGGGGGNLRKSSKKEQKVQLQSAEGSLQSGKGSISERAVASEARQATGVYILEKRSKRGLEE